MKLIYNKKSRFFSIAHAINYAYFVLYGYFLSAFFSYV